MIGIINHRDRISSVDNLDEAAFFLSSSSSFQVDRNVRLLLLFRGGRITYTDFFSVSYTTPRGGGGSYNLHDHLVSSLCMFV